MAYTRLSLGLPPELVSKVDDARGDIPRERWLRRLVEQHFESEDRGEPVRARTDGRLAWFEPATDRSLGPHQAGRPHTPAGQHEFKEQSGTFRCGVCGVAKGQHA